MPSEPRRGKRTSGGSLNDRTSIGKAKSMNQFFIESFDIRQHPIRGAKKKTQAEYQTALLTIIKETLRETNCERTEAGTYIAQRLRLYCTRLFADIPALEKAGANCLMPFQVPWKAQYGLLLVCDVSLILLEDSLIDHAIEKMKALVTTRRRAEIDQAVSMLHSTQAPTVPKKYSMVVPLIRQYRNNRAFLAKKERRIIVTANVSAGKSTLINALIGKPIARTSQEVCTGNLCYIFNKPYEDGNVHLLAEKLALQATAEDLHRYHWDGPVSIATGFTGMESDLPRLCLIDTPGVDTTLYENHRDCTKQALLHDQYDMIVCVVGPNQLGTDAEYDYLHWMVQNVPDKKIVFVLNKLDEYRDGTDSVEESVQNFKKDLLDIGFAAPLVCPISAYFSCLLKAKMTGQPLSEDEADAYVLYAKRFRRPTRDLSRYYKGVCCLTGDSEEVTLSKCAGLYGLEKILYGGSI